MRFLTDGPDVPDSLVTAQERGDILFICGAGVSMGAGLPSFHGLVCKVYEALDEKWTDHDVEREVMTPGGSLTGQYDRMLRALERRMIANDVRQAQSIRRRIRDAVRKSLLIEGNPQLDDHLCLLELSRDAEHVNRIVTTNFDTLFERAWKKSKAKAIATYAVQSMPQPKTERFGGVLHLHGVLADSEVEVFGDSDLVLTSADFGDAYLRSGWASRYLYDLCRSHVLVLVGYSADDPPMRYLLEALEADRERFPDLKPVYAFSATDRDGKSKKHDTALWQAKGVEPILYSPDLSGSHLPLYATLRQWHSYAENPTAWRNERLTFLLTSNDADARNANLTEIADLLRHGDASRILAQISPEASWYPELTSRLQTSDHFPFSAWISKRIEDPQMIRACAGRIPPKTHWWDIDRALETKAKTLSKTTLLAWQCLRRVAFREEERFSRWYSTSGLFMSQVNSFESRLLVAETLTPRLSISAPRSEISIDEPDKLSNLIIIDFEPEDTRLQLNETLKYWTVDDFKTARLLELLCRHLNETLDEAADAHFLTKVDRASLDVPSVSDHPQNRHRRGFLPIVRFIAELWSRLAEAAPPHAREIATEWRRSSYLLIQRLHIFALTDKHVFNCEEAAEHLLLLDDMTFWSGDLRRETIVLLHTRWNDFTETDRGRLTARLLAGPLIDTDEEPSSLSPGQLESIRDRAIFTRLSRIEANGGRHDPATMNALNEIRSRHPKWLPEAEEREEFRTWSSTSWGDQGSPDLLATVDTRQIVREALRLQREQPWEQGDLWNAYCRADPERALEALRAATNGEPHNTAMLQQFFNAAAASEDAALAQQVAAFILLTPINDLRDSLRSATGWLERQAKHLLFRPLNGELVALSVWDHLSAVSEARESLRSDTPLLPMDDPLSVAINHPGGMLVGILSDLLSNEPGNEPAFSFQQLEPRFDQSVEGTGKAGVMAEIYLIRGISWLYERAPDWVVKRLVPRLTTPSAQTGMFWTSALGGGAIGNADLFQLLKGPLLSLFTEPGSALGLDPQALAVALIVPALRAYDAPADSWGRPHGELRRALRLSGRDVRQSAAWVLSSYLSEAEGSQSKKERWHRSVGPLVLTEWPVDAACRDARISSRLLDLALDAGEAFPDAVSTIAPLLVPFDMALAVISFELNEARKSVLESFPEDLIRLLNIVVDPVKAQPPRDLSDIISRCIQIQPSLIEEPAYKRLHAIALRLAA